VSNSERNCDPRCPCISGDATTAANTTSLGVASRDGPCEPPRSQPLSTIGPDDARCPCGAPEHDIFITELQNRVCELELELAFAFKASGRYRTNKDIHWHTCPRCTTIERCAGWGYSEGVHLCRTCGFEWNREGDRRP
jgi:hypothetical protein